MKFSVSIVTYKSNPALLAATVRSLLVSVAHARRAVPDLLAKLYVVENDNQQRQCLRQIEQLLKAANSDAFADVCLSTSESNLGFGGGHNQAINALDSDVHLVLNPDVELAEDAVTHALQYFASVPHVGLISPHASDDDGSQLYLCKRYPTVLDLFIRGFVPSRWQRPFAARLARYEMRELAAAAEPVNDIQIVSGCCMFVRTAPLQAVGGFDEAYFLYFEDFDLSLRLAALVKLAYVPAVRIVHHGGNASRKGWRHILLFARSSLRFFRSHGWRWV